MSSVKKPVNLVLDWDGTITKHDTLYLIAAVGIAHRALQDLEGTSAAFSPLSAPSESFVRDLVQLFRAQDTGKLGRSQNTHMTPLPAWSEITRAYLKDYQAHEEFYKPSKSERVTIEDESKWLRSLADVEIRSVQRVERAGIFRGITMEQVDAAASLAVAKQDDGGLVLRRGWAHLLEVVLGDVNVNGDTASCHGSSQQGQVTIVSVNWSAEFIRASLLAAARLFGGDGHYENLVNRVTINANKIYGIGSTAGASGSLTKDKEHGIRTSFDKIRHSPLEDELARKKCIYVGDSCTDLDCLLAAQIGICIRDEPMNGGQQELADTLDRLCISVQHVSNFDEGVSELRRRKTLWYAKDLEEVADLVRRLMWMNCMETG